MSMSVFALLRKRACKILIKSFKTNFVIALSSFKRQKVAKDLFEKVKINHWKLSSRKVIVSLRLTICKMIQKITSVRLNNTFLGKRYHW